MNDLSLKALNDSKMDINGITTSTTNGNIKVNGTETKVYTHPASHPSTMITGLATVATSGSSLDISFSNANFTSTNVNAALVELFQNVSNGKSSIASAITGKGISASGSDTFATLATKITSIQQGVGNATAAQVLSGYTFSNSSGTNISGTMTNNPANSNYSKLYQMANLCVNGSFESGSTNWMLVGSAVGIDTSQHKFSSNSMKIASSGGGAIAGSEQPVTVTAGHIYYGCTYVLKQGTISSGGTPGQFDIYATDTSITEMGNVDLNDTNIPTIGQWKMVSFRDIASATTSNARFRCYTWSTTPINIDGMILIDLTGVFGSGNEPTQAQMDNIVNAFGGWFDGVLSVQGIAQGAYLTNGILTGYPEIFHNQPGCLASKIAAGQMIASMPGTFTSDANASTSQILNGYTAYVNGNKITGSVPIIPADLGDSFYARRSGTTFVGSPYGDGVNYAMLAVDAYSYVGAVNWVRSSQPDLIAANIVSGKNIFGIAGSFSGKRTAVVNASQSITNGGTFTASGLAFVPSQVIIFGSVSMKGYESSNAQPTSNGGICLAKGSSFNRTDGISTRYQYGAFNAGDDMIYINVGISSVSFGTTTTVTFSLTTTVGLYCALVSYGASMTQAMFIE